MYQIIEAMNAVKFKLMIRLDKLAKSTNQAPVCLRITKDRQVMYKTILHIEPKYWDEKEQRIKKQHPNADLLNAQIANKKAEYEKETLYLTFANDSVGISTIRNKINNRTSFDLFEYSEKHLNQLFKEGKHATYKKYKSVIEKLKQYVKKDTLSIKSITSDFIKEYENYLLHTVKNNTNTTTVNLKVLAKLVGDIYRNYDLDEINNPFRKIKFKREQSDRTFLEIEEIKKIEDLNFRLQSPLYDAREIFLFECYTGIRISDILSLKWKNVSETEISISMRKTGKALSLPINNKVKTILDKKRLILENNYSQINSEKYVFNILKIDVENCNAQDALNAISGATAIINKKLKQVAEKAGINKTISSHVARHSFATALITKGADLLPVRDLLGHSDVRVTQIYAKVVSTKKQETINLLNNL